MTKIGKLVLGGLLGTLLFEQCLYAQPIARVLQVSGKAKVVSADGKTRPAATYGSVYAGEEIHLEPKSKVVVGFYAVGRIERVVSDKVSRVVTVTESAFAPRDGVTFNSIKKKQGRLAATQIKKLPIKKLPIKTLPKEVVPGVIVVRGPSPEIPSIIPISSSAVLKDFPEFSWPSQQDAMTYEISVYSNKDRLWTFQTKRTQTTYAAKQPLEPGHIYGWKVVAETPTGSQSVCIAVFKVAFAEDVKDAEGLGEVVESKEPSLLALAAERYEQLGLVAEAIDTNERLVAMTPKAAAVHAALSRLYKRAGRKEEAHKSREEATNLAP